MAELIQKLDTKRIVITFRLPRLFSFRMWLVVQLLRLANSIAPVTIEIETND